MPPWPPCSPHDRDDSRGVKKGRISRFFRGIIPRFENRQTKGNSGASNPGQAPTAALEVPHKRPESHPPEQLQEADDLARCVEDISVDNSGVPSRTENASTPSAAANVTSLKLLGHARNQDRGQSITHLTHLPSADTKSPGFFANASYCTLQNPVMNLHLNYHDLERVIESLEKHTIRGAEFDSSDRFPPPQCHPGTRKSILERMHYWLHTSEHRKKLLWLVGSAGAGKSAIMQTLAEYAADTPNLTLGATLFFSRPNGRNAPSKVFTTLAYQLALVNQSYREFVLRELVNNPRLPSKSMNRQFARLIVEPFVHQEIYQGPNKLLLFLDGLDECEGSEAQCEIVELISAFTLAHPNAPLFWVIASRPESHLQAIFSRKNILPSYDKEDVPLDSDEACADVEKYLRKGFERIQQDDPIVRLRPQWPTETEFLAIAAAAGGLFAYASTALKFIGDPMFKNPISGLALLLAAIDKVSLQPSKGRTHPLAYLDALYMCILSEIPKNILPDTNLLLTNHLAVLNRLNGQGDISLAFLSNWVHMPPNDVYSALDRFHSVLTIPSPEDAEGRLYFHHQSFSEYLKDPNRSQGYHISVADMNIQELECSLRILKNAHLAPETGATITVSNIVLSWETTDSAAMQRVLYDHAAWSFTGLIDRYSTDLSLPKLQDPDVIQITRTLDFKSSRVHAGLTVRHVVEFLDSVQCRMDPRIRARLESLKLLWTMPVGEIDLSNIDSKGWWMFVRCESNTPDKIRLESASESLGGPYPMEPHDSVYQYWSCSSPFNHDGHKERVLHDLRHARAETPDALVLLFGTVRTYLMYDYKTTDGSQRWILYAPYRLP